MDLVLRRGTVIDGVSGNLYQADVGIVDDYITRVGDLSRLPARQEIDASGLVVAPGFIDPDGRSDFSVLADPTQYSKVSQGVTTEAVGTGGLPPFPNTGAHAERVNRIARRYGIDPTWHDAAGYLKRLREAEPTINLAVFAGHGALRGAILGLSRRPATPHDLALMGERLNEDLACGLFGLSIGLSESTGSVANEEELATLAARLDPARHHLVLGLRSEGARIMDALAEALRVAERARVPLQLSHIKVLEGAPEGAAETVIAAIETARGRGMDITADCDPYAAAAASLSSLLPDWILADGLPATARRLRDALVRGRARAAIRQRLPEVASFARVRICRTSDPNDAWMLGLSLDEVHRRSGSGRDPAETVIDLLLRNELDIDALFFILDEKARESLLARPWTMPATNAASLRRAGTTADGLPHPRAFGTFARLLRRAHEEGGMRALAHAIRRMTSLPAERLRLPDRGRVAPGYRADLILLDPRQVRDLATFDNPFQPSAGIRTVFVNGRIAYRAGEGTLARAGRVLRPGPAE